MMSRMNSMLFSTAHTHTHTVSLRRRYESKLYTLLHELNVFYEQASSRTL
jgi:hypothetical protein